MPNTDRMNWPYPAENEDPWYTKFFTMLQAMDASGYASREDRHILLFGGGKISFVASTGVLTWKDPIKILGAVTGYYWYTSNGSVVLSDGQIAYVDLNRFPIGNAAVEVKVASVVPSTDNALLLCMRVGTKVFFRNGRSINDGSDFELLEVETGGGGGASPLTTKGDLYTHNGVADQRQGIGPDGTVLTADSTQPNGLRWGVGGSAGSPYPEAGSAPAPYLDPYLRYMATTGNDANDGETPATAWQTPAKVRGWLKDLIDQPCTVIVLDDYTGQPVPFLNLHGITCVRGGSLLICGELIQFGPPQGIAGAVQSPSDPNGMVTRLIGVAVPPNPEQYLIRIDLPMFLPDYAEVLDYDIGAGWIDISYPFGGWPPGGTVYFYTTNSNIELRFDSLEGDAPPSPNYAQNIAVMGLKTYTASGKPNRVRGCHGLVFEAMFSPSGTMWEFEDSSFLSIGYIEPGNPIFTRANIYLFSAGPMSPAGQGGYFGFASDPAVAPGFGLTGCSDVLWAGVSRHGLATKLLPFGSQLAGGNKGIGYRFCLFDPFISVNDNPLWLISVYSFNNLRLSGSKVRYAGVYCHGSWGQNTFSKNEVFLASNSEIIYIGGGGIRTGDPSLAVITANRIFTLDNCVYRVEGKNHFGPSDFIDCAESVFLLYNSRILGDSTWNTRFEFNNNVTPLQGNATKACIEMDRLSEVVCGQLIMGPLAFSTAGMPLVRGAGASKFLARGGAAQVDLNSGGGGADFGAAGAIVMTGGSYAEYGNMVGTNTNGTAIVLSLDKNARGYHPAAGTNPTVGSKLFIGGSGVVAYPLVTTNDLGGPGASELCVLSR